jgi:hypothetical protein
MLSCVPAIPLSATTCRRAASLHRAVQRKDGQLSGGEIEGGIE